MALIDNFEVTQPSWFRGGLNSGASVIPRGTILKRTANRGEVAAASSSSDAFAGVAFEDIYPGRKMDVKVDGPSVILAGAAFAIGTQLTTDSTGRAIAATSQTQNIIGVAVVAAGAAGDLAVAELTGSGWGTNTSVFKRTITIGFADLTAAAISQAFNIGAVLPTGARPIGWDVKVTQAFAKAAQTFTVIAGISGTTNKYITSQDISTGVNEFAGALGPKVADGEQWIATVTTNTGTVASSTAGALTLEILFAIPST